MRPEYFLPMASMCLNIGAALGYAAFGRNKWMAVYWLAAFTLTYIVTFKIK